MSRQLRHYLENTADHAETALTAWGMPGRITGGTVGPRLIRFTFAPAYPLNLAALCNRTAELAAAMQAAALRIYQAAGGIVLELPNPEPRPVTLLGLWPEVQPTPAVTALLGLTDDGAPLLARLPSPEVGHVLIVGDVGAGKSALLRTVGVSLALGNAPGALRLLGVDVGGGRAFRALAGAPQLLRPAVVTATEATEALASLGRLAQQRARSGERTPAIVALVDNAELLDSATLDALQRLVMGRAVGIHAIAATAAPALVEARFPLRLVGRVGTATAARLAAGQAETGAESLAGRGDFLAVPEGARPLRFQAAYIGEAEAREALQEGQAQPWPASGRAPVLPPWVAALPEVAAVPAGRWAE